MPARRRRRETSRRRSDAGPSRKGPAREGGVAAGRQARVAAAACLPVPTCRGWPRREREHDTGDTHRVQTPRRRALDGPDGARHGAPRGAHRNEQDAGHPDEDGSLAARKGALDPDTNGVAGEERVMRGERGEEREVPGERPPPGPPAAAPESGRNSCRRTSPARPRTTRLPARQTPSRRSAASGVRVIRPDYRNAGGGRPAARPGAILSAMEPKATRIVTLPRLVGALLLAVGAAAVLVLSATLPSAQTPRRRSR